LAQLYVTAAAGSPESLSVWRSELSTSYFRHWQHMGQLKIIVDSWAGVQAPLDRLRP
jgi:hypothetical protein